MYVGYKSQHKLHYDNFRPLPPEKYCYNIKEKMQDFPKSQGILRTISMKMSRKPLSMLLKANGRCNERKRTESKYYHLRYPKPVYSPRFRSKFSKSREKLR